MSLNNIGVLKALQTSMTWLSARQQVLADNVANASMPGYKAKDLEALNFDIILERTTNGRMPQRQQGVQRQGTSSGFDRSAVTFDTIIKADSETSPDGNSVVLEEQMLKINETQSQYQAATSLYKKSLNMLRIAIGKSR